MKTSIFMQLMEGELLILTSLWSVLPCILVVATHMPCPCLLFMTLKDLPEKK